MAIQYTEDYLEFYEVYPRKEGKADGYKAYTQLTDTERKLAQNDVEKRKRMNAYSANKKLVQLPASYLRARRWEDDWEDTLESSRKGDDQFVGLGAVVPRPIEVTPDLPWRERLLNRCYFAYRLESTTLPEVRSALQIKRELLEETADLTEPPAEQAEIIVGLFMNRMDAMYGLNIGAKAIRRARANKTVEIRV